MALPLEQRVPSWHAEQSYASQERRLSLNLLLSTAAYAWFPLAKTAVSTMESSSGA